LIIEAQAPTRIDLAGGTVDIWPLYLFHEGAQTINFAIDQYARCRVATRPDSKFVFESLDRGSKVEIETHAALRDDTELPLIAKLVYFFLKNAPTLGLTITTDCMAPAGAGLAGSSTLNIALCGALNKLTGERFKLEQLPFIAANVESQVLNVPAGYQDYFPATYGGVSRVRLEIEGVLREPIQTDLEQLEARVALCYTHAPRNSGINNWEMFKTHIDGDRRIFERFDAIRDTALKMADALAANAFDQIGAIFAEEWASRRELVPGITTEFIDELVALSQRHGAQAAKVCGAGGGGCVAFYCEAGRKADVEAALTQAGGQIIPYRISRAGLQLKIS
jgi:D-glycero-alpha-D-manno-heptose-7-phosphate kinase